MSETFVGVYEKHVWDVYGYLAYRLQSPADAEDLTQVTFERAYKAWSGFDASRANVKTWLLAIARNAMIDHLRKRPATARQEVSSGDWEFSSSSEDPERSLGTSPELMEGLQKLGRRERSVIALRFGGDLKGPEIAEMLGLSVANVQQITSRALRKLRTDLERSGAERETLTSGSEGPEPSEADPGDREEE